MNITGKTKPKYVMEMSRKELALLHDLVGNIGGGFGYPLTIGRVEAKPNKIRGLASKIYSAIEDVKESEEW